MRQSGVKNSVFKEKNISMRKQIREKDMYQEWDTKNINRDVSILLIGPQASGKSSLTKTFYFALNSNINTFEPTCRSYGYFNLKSVQIKKNKRNKIEGLEAVTQSEPKMAITILQMEPQNKAVDIYTYGLEAFQNTPLTCFRDSFLNCFTSFRVTLICLRIDQPIEKELGAMRSFVQECSTKLLIILTHLDMLAHMLDEQRAQHLDHLILQICQKIQLISYDDVICMESYHEPESISLSASKCSISSAFSQLSSTSRISGSSHPMFTSKTSMRTKTQDIKKPKSIFNDPKELNLSRVEPQITNNEQINFYALRLILKCIIESEQQSIELMKTNKSKAWLCF